MSNAETLNQYIKELFDYGDGKNDDFEPIPIPKEVDDDEYYYPDDEFAERMSVVVWFILSLGCAILWVGIPLLICGLIVYTELEEHCPELMGDMTDRNTEEFDKEENK